MQLSKLITSRSQAFSILGIPEDSDETDIKKAYKNLVKLFHPDMASLEDNEVYNRVVEAYEFLCTHPTQPTADSKQPKKTNTTTSTGKILGSPNQIYRSGANKEAFERKYQAQKAQKAEAWDRQMEQYVAEQKRREEEYKRTMEAINAIRIAEAIKALVKDLE